LPPGFREAAESEVGGELEPVLAAHRTFVALDGGRRIDVGVALAASPVEAQEQLTERVNQLLHFLGWNVAAGASFGDTAYRATTTTQDGSPASMVLFRVNSIRAEVAVTGDGNTGGPQLLDTVAGLVEELIMSDSDAAVELSGFPTPTPPIVPGWDPQVIVPDAGVVGAVAPGAEVIGSSSGSAIPGDTIVNFAVTAVDRPWQPTGGTGRVPPGLEYLTVEVQIDVNGQTEVALTQTDFWVSTFDGRSWSPITGRTPILPAGTISSGAPRRGWLTFLLPSDQPALQLSWRLRTNQALADQSNQDQTLVVPLVAGATASASVGSSPPPAGIPIVPPSSAPAGGSGPSGPSGPSAPSGTGSGTGGGSAPRSGTRLQ
jgi:hypothetical protein